MSEGKWRVEHLPGLVQVVPVDDLIVHTRDLACTCAPRIETFGYTCPDHGSMGVLAVTRQLVHEAMDGRE